MSCMKFCLDMLDIKRRLGDLPGLLGLAAASLDAALGRGASGTHPPGRSRREPGEGPAGGGRRKNGPTMTFFHVGQRKHGKQMKKKSFSRDM